MIAHPLLFGSPSEGATTPEAALLTPASAGSSRISVLQLGAAWFSEQPGGLERYFAELLTALRAVGVSTNGLVVGSHRVATESDGRVIAFASADQGLLSRWRAIRTVFDQDPAMANSELVVSHFACYTFPVLRHLRGRPLVVHFHGPWSAEGKQEGNHPLNVFFKHQVERSVYRRADRLITLSSAFRDLLCDQYKVSPERVRVIPGGVDTRRFSQALETPRRAARQRLGWPVDRPIILLVRRLAARMGLENLVDAMTRVKVKHPDVLCLIAGRGRLQQALEHQITALGLGHHVKLLGFVSDSELPFAYRAADLSILPSIALEGFGLSAAESLAVGTPALVTPVGGLPEVVEALSADLVLPDISASSIAERISWALEHPESLPDARACSQFAMRKFDWHNIVPLIRSVYEESSSA